MVEDTGIPAAWMLAKFSDLHICGIRTAKLNSITRSPLVHWRIQGTVPSMQGAPVFDTVKDEVTALIDIVCVSYDCTIVYVLLIHSRFIPTEFAQSITLFPQHRQLVTI
jgi:hypothetical protein